MCPAGAAPIVGVPNCNNRNGFGSGFGAGRDVGAAVGAGGATGLCVGVGFGGGCGPKGGIVRMGGGVGIGGIVGNGGGATCCIAAASSIAAKVNTMSYPLNDLTVPHQMLRLRRDDPIQNVSFHAMSLFDAG